jgi:sulfite exporter TauE/SafE
MCGGFVLHLSLGERQRRGWLRPALHQALWHVGRLGSYAFVGALAGWAGSALTLAGWQLWQRALAVLAGAAMAAAGLVMLGLRRGRTKVATDAPPGLLAGLLRFLPAQPSAGSALALGMVCSVLPCPVVLAFVALAASTQSVAGGIITMAAMGAGTVWSLALLAAGARLVGPGVRRWAAPVGGVLLILLGAVTVLRATPWHHAVFGCPAAPAASQPAACPHCTGPTSQP